MNPWEQSQGFLFKKRVKMTPTLTNNVHLAQAIARRKNESSIKWTNYGDFSVHRGTGYACINPHYKKEWREQDDLEIIFNDYQYFLLRRCIYGLAVYSKDELKYMNKLKIKRIVNTHRRAKNILNLFRQKVVSAQLEITIRQVIPKAKLNESFWRDFLDSMLPAEEDIKIQETKPIEFTLTFKDLGVDKRMIAQELIDNKVLPSKFWDLTIHDDPRMIRLKAPQQKLDE